MLLYVTVRYCMLLYVTVCSLYVTVCYCLLLYVTVRHHCSLSHEKTKNKQSMTSTTCSRASGKPEPYFARLFFLIIFVETLNGIRPYRALVFLVFFLCSQREERMLSVDCDA